MLVVFRLRAMNNRRFSRRSLISERFHLLMPVRSFRCSSLSSFNTGLFDLLCQYHINWAFRLLFCEHLFIVHSLFIHCTCIVRSFIHCVIHCLPIPFSHWTVLFLGVTQPRHYLLCELVQDISASTKAGLSILGSMTLAMPVYAGLFDSTFIAAIPISIDSINTNFKNESLSIASPIDSK